ncbi:unnamed protein product [Clonostachys chloroleuca]|uniref:Chromo domain-containing protein n=1 Tax=Clonostachys chloroleuca TaxID=1926264 RepID=A0AA35LVI1_9HYPO|nr:unnamed protein product [Clonostachys chloroleuca]
MAQTVFIGRELEVPADEFVPFAAGSQTNPAEGLDMFLHLSDSGSSTASTKSPLDESRQTSPVALPSSVEPVIAASEKSDQGEESIKPAEPTPARKSAKKMKATKEVKTPSKASQRRNRRTQMEIYGTGAPRRSGRVPTTAPVQTSRAATKKTRVSKTDAPKKRGRKKAQAGAKQQTPKSGQQWEVESIVDSQIDADTMEHFYKVKWKGYSSKENTWEPKSNLVGCQDALKEYERQKKKKK